MSHDRYRLPVTTILGIGSNHDLEQDLASQISTINDFESNQCFLERCYMEWYSIHYLPISTLSLDIRHGRQNATSIVATHYEQQLVMNTTFLSSGLTQVTKLSKANNDYLYPCLKLKQNIPSNLTRYVSQSKQVKQSVIHSLGKSKWGKE